jgi:hypothetical protein
MKGYIPIPGSDFIFDANGFKCGVGLYADPDITWIGMTKEKVKGGGSQTDANTWELIKLTNDPELETLKAPYNGDAKKFYAAWLAEANVTLKQKTGGGSIPAYPTDTIINQLLWLSKYGLAFRSETTEVFVK